MRIGFTGTRKGMSQTQKDNFGWMLAVYVHADAHVDQGMQTQLHHGAAQGADRQAAAIAKLHLQNWIQNIKVHPAGADPLRRNRDIVAACDILIAAPETDKEELRSGTWATVRYARAKGIPVVMLPRGKA